MQVLLTVNNFSTNRRRLIVKQTKTAGEIYIYNVQRLRRYFFDYVMPHLDPKCHDASHIIKGLLREYW